MGLYSRTMRKEKYKIIEGLCKGMMISKRAMEFTLVN